MRSRVIVSVSCMLLVSSPLYSGTNIPALRPGSIGVLYVRSHTADSTRVEIAFPADSLDQYPQSLRETSDYKAVSPVTYKGSLVVFDQKGVMAKLALSDPIILQFWCENDGGMQFRPTLKTTIKNSVFARPLRPRAEIQNIAAFVALAGSADTIAPITWDTSNLDIRLKGSRNANDNPEALISVSQDDAGNCDGEPDNNLTINLETSGGQLHAMRCCGP